ncbi:hypothetical protein D3C76_667170 [compost metagenome]
MVVAMSCENCLHLYNEIITRRPEWHDEDPLKCDEEGSSYWKITLGFTRSKVMREFFCVGGQSLRLLSA